MAKVKAPVKISDKDKSNIKHDKNEKKSKKKC